MSADASAHVAGAAAAVSAGAAAMKVELAGTSALLSAGALWMSQAIEGPSYGTRIMLMVAGCMLGTFASAFVSEEPNWKERAQNAIGALFVGFGLTLIAVVLFPSIKTADYRDFLLLVGFGGSFFARWILAWARSRGVVNATLDFWADRAGLKTNKRGKREKGEDGRP